MGKSEAGPDMLDCAAYLRELDKNHKVVSSVLILAGGSMFTSHLTVCIFSATPSERLSEGEGKATTFEWPNRENKTFEGALYRALVDHDAMMTKGDFMQQIGLT